MPENATQSTPPARETFTAWAAGQWHGAPAWYRAAAPAAVIVGTALAIAKAFSTGIGYDEAYNWHLYLQHDFARIWTHFDANNHLLNTFLSRLSIEVFGPHEWAMRLPALAGRLAFLLAVPLLCALLLRGWGLRLGILALIAAQPVLLDYGALSRGYSLALAFAAWGLAAGLWKMARDTAAPPPPLRHDAPLLIGISILFGLSAATVPVFINFAAPFCAIVAGRELLSRGPWRRAVYTGGLLALPAAVLNFAAWGPLLPLVQRADLYMGAPTPWFAYQSLHFALLYYENINTTPLPDWPFRAATALLVSGPAQVGTALLLAAAVAAGLLQRTNLPLRWTAAALLAAGGVSAAQSLLLRFPWPVDRTILYAVPLLLLIVPAALQTAVPAAGRRWRMAGWTLFALFAVYQSSKLTLEWYYPFRTSGPVREVIQKLQARAPAEGPPILFVYTEWVRWDVDYYRAVYDLDGIEFLRDDQVDSLTAPRPDYILTFIHEAPDHPAYTEEARYPIAPLVLLRRENAGP